MWSKIKTGNINDQHPMLYQGSSSSAGYTNPEPTNQDGDNVWYQLAEIYQTFIVYDRECIQKTGKNLYGAMVNEFINNPQKYTKNTNRTIAAQNMALAMSNVLGKDITPHFENYKHVINAEAKKKAGVDLLPKDTGRKTWYSDAKLRDPDSIGFNSVYSPYVTYKTGSGVTLEMSLPGESAKAFLCYEIIKNGKIIGIEYGTENSTYATFNDPSGTSATEYTVIAYDRKCYPSQPKIGSVNNPGSEQSFAIIRQPEDKDINLGQSVTLNVSASASEGTLSYQWYENSAKTNTGGSIISGATGSSFSPQTNKLGIRYYYCEVTNTVDGEKAVKIASNAVSVAVTESYIITVYQSPEIGGTAEGSGIYRGGTPVTLTAAPNSGYEFDGWYRNNIKLSDNEVYTFNAEVSGMYEARFKLIKFEIKNIEISGNLTTGNQIVFTASATAGTKPLKYAFYILGGGKVWSKTVYSNTNTFSYTPAEKGNYSVRAYAIDAAGNKCVYSKDFTVK